MQEGFCWDAMLFDLRLTNIIAVHVKISKENIKERVCWRLLKNELYHQKKELIQLPDTICLTTNISHLGTLILKQFFGGFYVYLKFKSKRGSNPGMLIINNIA